MDPAVGEKYGRRVISNLFMGKGWLWRIIFGIIT